MSRVIAVTALLLVGACASTGATMIGKDTFVSSARVPFAGESGAKAKVLQEAAASCQAQGKLMKLVDMNSHECALHGGCGEAQITYMCLSKDDPRY